MSILLTGFGPFPGVPRNPSQLLVERFADAWGGRRVHRLVLPTVYETAPAMIEARLAELRPDACLCLGVAGPGPLRLETLARNHDRSEVPDHAGALRRGAIRADGPEAYPATLPLAAMEGAMTRQGVAVACSDDAGGYLCNHVFYAARYAIERHGLATACGFIHIPPVDPADDEDEAVGRMARAIEIAVEVLIGELQATESSARRTAPPRDATGRCLARPARLGSSRKHTLGREPDMSLLDPALRRVTSIREAEFRPYDRYGTAIPGLSWVPLGGEEGGCFLLRFAAGAASRPHEHAEGEAFLVLDGVLEDSDGQRLRAGDYVSYQPGSRHFSTAPEGCTLLVLRASGNRLIEGA